MIDILEGLIKQAYGKLVLSLVMKKCGSLQHADP